MVQYILSEEGLEISQGLDPPGNYLWMNSEHITSDLPIGVIEFRKFEERCHIVANIRCLLYARTLKSPEL
jgi:hypothetical protein